MLLAIIVYSPMPTMTWVEEAKTSGPGGRTGTGMASKTHGQVHAAVHVIEHASPAFWPNCPHFLPSLFSSWCGRQEKNRTGRTWAA